jgi:hypothetical protein
MLEIILTLSLYTNSTIKEPITISSSENQYSINTQHKILINNMPVSGVFNLIEGENSLSVISKDNQVLEHLLIITQPKLCDYLDAKILEANIEQDTVKVSIPDNCNFANDKFTLFVDSHKEINSNIIKTNLVSTAEAAILLYENKVIDYQCWINSEISKTEEKDFQRFNIDKKTCTQKPQIDKNKKTDKKNTQEYTKDVQNNEINKKDLIISSIMPNADSEFIIIKNQSDKAINLKDVYLQDKTQAQHGLSGNIKPNEEMKIDKLGFTLNNSQEEIYIKNKHTEEEIDVFKYHKSTPNTLVTKTTPNIKSKEVEIKTQDIQKNQTISSIPHKHLILSEVYANPSGKEKEFEYIEIFNPNTSSITTNNYKILINNKEVALPKTLEPQQYWTSKGVALSNTGAHIEIYFEDQLIQEFKYDKAKEDISFIYLNNKWYITSLKSQNKANGTAKKYQGDLIIENNELKIDGLTILQNEIKIENGIYSKVNILLHYLDTSTELIEIKELQLKELKKHDTKPPQDITSIGMLSMASLAIIYNFIK